MRKISEAEMGELCRKQKEEQIAQELAEMLCGGARRIPKEIMGSAPAGYDDAKEPGQIEPFEAEPARLIQVDMETGTMAPVEIEYGRMLMTDAPGGGIVNETNQQEENERKSLRLHNEAISALDALIQNGIDDDETAERAEELLDRLRDVRMNTFEYMVPWERLARGNK